MLVFVGHTVAKLGVSLTLQAVSQLFVSLSNQSVLI